jgi:hypothetical protein
MDNRATPVTNDVDAAHAGIIWLLVHDIINSMSQSVRSTLRAFELS